jgi:hypothetical protein
MNTTAGTRAICAALAMATVAGGASAAEKGIHLAGGGTVGFTWYMNDGAGFRWDISSNGQVSDGTNDAYDGGMQLRIAGSYFSNSSQARLAGGGREIEIGPWTRGNLRIYRRIYVDAKIGYCRWIDIFENSSAAAETAAVMYYTNVGGSVNKTYSSSGKETVGPNDWGVVTSYTSSSSRPSIVHVFATQGAKVKPKYRRSTDSIYQEFSLKIPPKKAMAVCMFQAQRRPYTEAIKTLKEFNTRHELAKVPAPLRRIIVNMGGATLMLGNVDLPRHEKHDLAVLRNGNELLGKILNERFDLQTFYGRLELPAAQVVGLSVPAPDDPHVQIVLVDGQIAAGTLLNAPLRIRLTNGNEMSLPPSKLSSATFALSPDRPEQIKLTRSTVTLRSGQRLTFRQADLDCTFHTEYGDVKLDPDDLTAIQFDTLEGGLHRAMFRNGTILSGLLTDGDLKLTLDLGPTLAIRRHLLRTIVFPSERLEPGDLTELTLRNEDQLFGRIVEESLTVATRYGKVKVKPSEIASLQIPEAGTLGQVQIKLHSGTTISGQFVGDTVAFQIDPGPKLPIFIGHVLQIACPKAPGSAATQPAEDKPDPAPTPPTTRPAVRMGPTTQPGRRRGPATRPARAPVPRTEAIEVRTRAEKARTAEAKELAANIKAIQAELAELSAKRKALAAVAARAGKADNAEGLAKQMAEVDKALAEAQLKLKKEARKAALTHYRN